MSAPTLEDVATIPRLDDHPSVDELTEDRAVMYFKDGSLFVAWKEQKTWSYEVHRETVVSF